MIFAFSLVFLGFMFTKPAQADTAYCNCNEFGEKECDAIIGKTDASVDCKKVSGACANKECPDYAETACNGDCYWKGATSKCVAEPADCTGYTFDVTPITAAMCTAVGCLFDTTGVKCAKRKTCSEHSAEPDCTAASCVWNVSCKDRVCASYGAQGTCETGGCKWTAPSTCAAKTCADQTTCDGSYAEGKICNADATCTAVALDSDCAVFKGENTCKRGTKTCKWDVTCKQAECKDLAVATCDLPRFYNLGGTATICKKVDTACAAGVATDLTETTCAINNYYRYAWKDGSCQACDIKTEGEDHATIFALGVLSILALSF